MIRASIFGSLMILFILLARRMFLKRIPKQCFRLLWILAALRLVIPCFFTLEIAVDDVPVQYTDYAIFDFSDTVGEGVSALDAELTAPSVNIEMAVVFIYIFGILVSVGSMVYAYFRMCRIARSASPVEPGDGYLLDDTDVRSGKRFDSPFSCGVFHPVIFIPEHMLSFDKEELDMVIAHEKQHIKCGDQLVKMLIAAAVCVNWYNPLAWIMLRVANRDIELACDEAVVRENGEKAEYAMLLIKATESRNGYAVCSFGAPVLNERIECIMTSKRITVYGFILAALMLSVMTVFFIRISAVKQQADNKFDETEYSDNDSTERLTDETEVQGVYDTAAVGESIVLMCPLDEYGAVTGKFGEQVSPIGKVYYNTGMNIAAEKGTAVCSAASGKVVTAEYNHDKGNYVVIDHGNGCETVYYHLNELFCESGDEVQAGCKIGSVGSTGAATGPNLGFAIIKDGTYVSPADLFE